MADATECPLSKDEVLELRRQTIDAQIENEKYLRDHPEIAAVLGEVTRQVVLRRPDEPVAFAEDFLATEDLKALYGRLKEERSLPPQ